MSLSCRIVSFRAFSSVSRPRERPMATDDGRNVRLRIRQRKWAEFVPEHRDGRGPSLSRLRPGALGRGAGALAGVSARLAPAFCPEARVEALLVQVCGEGSYTGRERCMQLGVSLPVGDMVCPPIR